MGGGGEGAAVSRSVDLGALARAAAAEWQQQQQHHGGGGEGCEGSGGSAAGRSRVPSHATGGLGVGRGGCGRRCGCGFPCGWWAGEDRMWVWMRVWMRV